MQRLKLLGLALVAVFALSAAAASVASAELVSFLPEGPVTFSAKGGISILEKLNKQKVECEKSKGSGATEAGTDPDKGTFKTEFEGCKAEIIGIKVKCADLGQTSDEVGIIKVEGQFHLRMGLSGQPLGIIAFLVNPDVHFLCGGVLFLVLGCAAGEINKINELVNSLTVKLTQAAGENTISSIDNLAETAMEPCVLLTSQGSGTEETSGEQTTQTLEGFKKGGLATTVLVHA